ncbi:MAG: tetratricopeptide repeat protein [bacterium]|nr:tetratricopeptide repeat protein [bacterium]
MRSRSVRDKIFHSYPMSLIMKNREMPCRPGRAGFVILCIAILFLMLPSHAGSQSLTLEEWLDLGWGYYNAGNIDDAFNTFLGMVENFPDSAEAHLALGEMYLEKGIVDHSRSEILTSLNLDDESEIAARAHYLYATSIREEDPWNALLHLDRAYHLGSSQELQFEIAKQHRFCILIIQMPERAESGLVVLHYASYLISQEEADNLANQAEGALFLAETYCYFDVIKPLHIFLYPSADAVRAEVMYPENDWDPKHREYHIPFSANIDFLTPLSNQVIYDLQQSMNRHAGAPWVNEGLPVAISEKIEWVNPELPEGVDSSEVQGAIYIGCDDAVRALVSGNSFVDLKYIIQKDYNPYMDWSVRLAELGSFLNWVRRTYERQKFQELITQPNVEIILGADLETIRQDWITELTTEPNLISDPELAQVFVQGLPLSPLSGDPELPLNVLKEGLRLYLSGEKVTGLWEIQRAVDLDPGLAIGYYTLGWIACVEKNWSEAEQQLGLALLLFDTPEEVAWCHSLLVPIYLNQRQWGRAEASCRQIALYGTSQEAVGWATNTLPRIEHIIGLQPPEKLDESAQEFSLMTSLLEQVDNDLNGVSGDSAPTGPNAEAIRKYVSDMMDGEHAEKLVNFYSEILAQYPTAIFRHEVVSVGTIGTAVYAEVLVHADFPAVATSLPPAFQALKRDGYLLMFQAIPFEAGWKFLDWEDAWFPDTVVSYSVHEPVQ